MTNVNVAELWSSQEKLAAELREMKLYASKINSVIERAGDWNHFDFQSNTAFAGADPDHREFLKREAQHDLSNACAELQQRTTLLMETITNLRARINKREEVFCSSCEVSSQEDPSVSLDSPGGFYFCDMCVEDGRSIQARREDDLYVG